MSHAAHCEEINAHHELLLLEVDPSISPSYLSHEMCIKSRSK
jgi:hypothetical protein